MSQKILQWNISDSRKPSAGQTHSMGSVTVMTKGRERLTLSSGTNSSLSSYRLHQRSSPVSCRFFAARFRSIAGA